MSSDIIERVCTSWLAMAMYRTVRREADLDEANLSYSASVELLWHSRSVQQSTVLACETHEVSSNQLGMLDAYPHYTKKE